jgi:hypothetical protein
VGRMLTLTEPRVLWMPRHGNAPEEWEDAFACNNSAGRFAIADGASESIFAGEWARFLCDAFVADSAGGFGIGPWLGVAQRNWQAHIGGLSVPWHVAEKLDDGAFATFLGLSVERNGDGASWQAVAVGDTCLFIVRGDVLEQAFPVRSAADFGTRPNLIGSRQQGRVPAVSARGTLAPGDGILLMTDALAAWFLAEHGAGCSPWRDLSELTADGFPGWVADRQASRRLKNDDVTLVVMDVGGADGDHQVLTGRIAP